jgi:HPt (histidine-containing phosphotransfer) domain-containing protein
MLWHALRGWQRRENPDKALQGVNDVSTGDTSTSQLSQHALILRFLTRTRHEIDQMRACLPSEPLALESSAIETVGRIGHKIASAAEPFGFPEIAIIAGALELMAPAGGRTTMRERLEFLARAAEKVDALEMYVEHALAETEKLETELQAPVAARGLRSSSRLK